MKFAEEIFPLGTFKGQESGGAYIDRTLAINLDVLARRITKDMHFLGIISGHDMVRNGKTTIATQIATYLTWKINQLHGLKNEFTDEHMVFSGADLERLSFKIPKYSVIVLDEGDDLTTHGMKELAVKLKRYFRKCGQLNQILLLILPSFFELPKFFALSRSHFLIDVFFRGEFERGSFKFYSQRNKKMLYLKGKREWDYEAYKADFSGGFASPYYFFPNLEDCVARYKKKKYDDARNETFETRQTPSEIRREVKVKLFHQIYNNLDGISVKELSRAFGVSQRTGFAYLREASEGISPTPSSEDVNVKEKVLPPIGVGIIDGGTGNE